MSVPLSETEELARRVAAALDEESAKWQRIAERSGGNNHVVAATTAAVLVALSVAIRRGVRR